VVVEKLDPSLTTDPTARKLGLSIRHPAIHSSSDAAGGVSDFRSKPVAYW
jgi:hypothetical protein